jgi:hypothetical protein
MMGWVSREMALIFAFQDETGQWHGDDPRGAVGWSSARTGWLTFRLGPGQPGSESPVLPHRCRSMSYSPDIASKAMRRPSRTRHASSITTTTSLVS